MALFTCCLYLLLIVLAGYTVLSAIQPDGRLTLAQLAGLTPAVGAGTVGLLLFWASLLGFAPSRGLLAVIGGLAAAGLLVLRIQNQLTRIELRPAKWQPDDRWMFLPLAVIAAAVAIMVINAVSTPLSEWDAFAIWGFKAKVVTHEALRPAPLYFQDLSLSYSHLEYPLLVPLLISGAYAAMGTVDDQTGKLVSVFLDLLLVPMVYLGLRWKLRRLPAMCLCVVLVLLPVLFRYAGTGCADLPLATFYAGSIWFVARWIDQQRLPDLLLAVLFSAFMAFTKNEGLILAIMNGVVMLGFGLADLRNRRWLGALLFFGGLLAIDAAWLIWSRDLPRTDEDYGSKLLSAEVLTHLSALKQIVPAMIALATEPHNWGLLWITAGGLALLGWRAFGRRTVLAVWILVGMQWLSYALVYSVTPWNLSILMPLTLDRLMLHALPAIILLAGWHWGEGDRSQQAAGSSQ